MESYVWSFPILFILHDLEELIGFKWWLNGNIKSLETRFPKIASIFANYNTEGMALAVFEEFIICLLVCGCSLFFNKNWLWCLWWGVFLAYAIHLVVHILQCIVFKKYIPCLITSIICLPISIIILIKTYQLLQASNLEITSYSIIGIIAVAINLIFAQRLIKIIK